MPSKNPLQRRRHLQRGRRALCLYRKGARKFDSLFTFWEYKIILKSLGQDRVVMPSLYSSAKHNRRLFFRLSCVFSDLVLQRWFSYLYYFLNAQHVLQIVFQCQVGLICKLAECISKQSQLFIKVLISKHTAQDASM